MHISVWSSDVCSSDLRSRKRSDIRDVDSGSEDASRLSREPSLRAVSEHEQENAPRPELQYPSQRIQAIVQGDRTSVVKGKSVSVHVEPGGRRTIKTNTQ